MTLPRVFLDISIENNAPERVIMELRNDVAPKTANLFRILCTGESGISYKRSLIKYAYENSFVVGGQIYNAATCVDFAPETCNLEIIRGSVLMCPQTKGSQFVICCQRNKILESKFIVIGKVLEGLQFIDRIISCRLPTGAMGMKVSIEDCGQLENPICYTGNLTSLDDIVPTLVEVSCPESSYPGISAGSSLDFGSGNKQNVYETISPSLQQPSPNSVFPAGPSFGFDHISPFTDYHLRYILQSTSLEQLEVSWYIHSTSRESNYVNSKKNFTAAQLLFHTLMDEKRTLRLFQTGAIPSKPWTLPSFSWLQSRTPYSVTPLFDRGVNQQYSMLGRRNELYPGDMGVTPVFDRGVNQQYSMLGRRNELYPGDMGVPAIDYGNQETSSLKAITGGAERGTSQAFVTVPTGTGQDSHIAAGLVNKPQAIAGGSQVPDQQTFDTIQASTSQDSHIPYGNVSQDQSEVSQNFSKDHRSRSCVKRLREEDISSSDDSVKSSSRKKNPKQKKYDSQASLYLKEIKQLERDIYDLEKKRFDIFSKYIEKKATDLQVLNVIEETRR